MIFAGSCFIKKTEENETRDHALQPLEYSSLSAFSLITGLREPQNYLLNTPMFNSTLSILNKNYHLHTQKQFPFDQALIPRLQLFLKYRYMNPSGWAASKEIEANVSITTIMF